MFGKLGQIMSMLKDPSKMQEAFQRFQESLGKVTAEGDAGAGMVKVRVNGNKQMVRCELSDELMQMNDKEMMEDLIRAATNQAMEKVNQAINEERNRMVEDMGLPAGMNLPGMG